MMRYLSHEPSLSLMYHQHHRMLCELIYNSHVPMNSTQIINLTRIEPIINYNRVIMVVKRIYSQESLAMYFPIANGQ